MSTTQPPMGPEPPWDPANPHCWIWRGRKPAHAHAIATAWRDYPDLPASACRAERDERFRQRVAALRPVNDAIAEEARAEREANNFAYVENRQLEGQADERDVAILRARARYGYNWDLAGRYADGWYAAHAGWPHNNSEAVPCRAPRHVARAAYDQGFADGGGDRTDLFDVARRVYLADGRSAPIAEPPLPPARPLPSAWTKPTDAPRPACWSRRLIIISDQDAHDQIRPAWNYLNLIHEQAGAEKATVLVLTNAGLIRSDKLAISPTPREVIDVDVASAQLRDLVAGRTFDDVLIALEGEDLILIDRMASIIPLARTMERTGNTPLQRRAHLRTWLSRGYDAGAAIGGGHIRWGKFIHGYTAKLGEFTARHVGPAPAGGHLVVVEVSGGRMADGYAGPSGEILSPQIVVSSKARLRATITATLRAFAGATPLMAAAA